MNIKWPITVLSTICFGLLLMTVSAFERPAYAQCETVTDAQMVEQIYAKFKTDKNLAAQLSHINVVSIYRVVKLQGWTDTKKDYDRAYDMVSSTKCVVMINTHLFKDAPPEPDGTLKQAPSGCQAGMKPCGDICIPEGDACNISGGETKND